LKKTLLFSTGPLIGIGVSVAQDVPKVEVPIGFSFINGEGPASQCSCLEEEQERLELI
jgi:hypothetical protein